MRKSAFVTPVLACLIVLSGCASAPTAPHGNFVQKTEQSNDKKIADDVVKKLVALYPPAKTRFDLQHATPDFFGGYLVESMRAKGYAIAEFKQSAETASAAPAAGLSFSYVFDQPMTAEFYRVTVVIDRKQSLDRVYQIKDGSVYPASYWARKE